MPVTNTISGLNNANSLTPPSNGFSSQLVYFIVSLVIQTEYASNGNKNLTQKQITELFNIGATIDQIYKLTVVTKFADDATFLNSIPLAYAANVTPAAGTASIIDEIIALNIPNANSYVSLIQYQNTPGANCWAFGSIDIINISIAASNASTGATINLSYINDNTKPNADGNTLASLWKLFNANNTLPTDGSAITLANVAPSVQNYIKLSKFLANTTGIVVNSNNTFTKDYTTLVTNGKIPVEVLLCTDYSLVTPTNSYTTTSSMNKLWNFLTNNNQGTSVTSSTISTTAPLVNPLTFSAALKYLNTLGFLLPRIMNVDKTKTVDTTYSDEVSAIVKLVAATPSLISSVKSVYSTWSTYASADNYLLDLISAYNNARTACINLGGVSGKVGSTISYNSTLANNVASTTPDFTSNQIFTSPSAAQTAALNSFKLAQALLAQAVSVSKSNLAFRLSLNGYYPLSTLTLANASKFLLSADSIIDVFNFVQDNSANLQAISNSNSALVISPQKLYLVNKLVSIITSGVVSTATDDSTKSFKFDIASLITKTTAIANGSTTTLMLGDGTLQSNVIGSTSSVWTLVESVISLAYAVNSSSLLVPMVNGLGDYADDNSYIAFDSFPSIATDLDNTLFTSSSSKLARAIKELVTSSPTDYNFIATIVDKAVKFGQSTQDILQLGDATIINGLGGDVNAAVAAYILSLTKPVDVATQLNTFISGGAIQTATPDYRLVAKKLLVVANSLNVDIGALLLKAALSGGATIITTVTLLVNYWFNPDNSIASSPALVSIIKAFFNLSGLTSAEIQTQITIKKIMSFYSSVSNDVINAVHNNNIPLGMWVKYVNLSYLVWSNSNKSSTNYIVDELLAVSQELSIYDYSSGKSTGIINLELITAENLVLIGALTVQDLPDYITYTGTSGSNLVTSQQLNLQLIVTVAKAMDQAAGSKLYTINLLNKFKAANTTQTLTAVLTYLNKIFANITLIDPNTLDNSLTTVTPPSNASYDVNVLAGSTIGGTTPDQISKLLNYVFQQFNADGTPVSRL